MFKWDDSALAEEHRTEAGAETMEMETEISENQDSTAAWQEQIEQLEAEKQKNYDLYLRALAEADNMKKRSQREREEYMRYGNERLLKKLLTVMDDLERALEECDRSQDLPALKHGIEITAKNLEDILKGEGLEPIPTASQEFDPQVHQALSVEPHPELSANMIIEEMQKGYLLHERLIRPALVRVSQ